MVTTIGKVAYTAEVKNIYGVPPPPPEDNQKAIENLNTIVQGMQIQTYELEGLEQANILITRSNSAVMEKIVTDDCDNELHAGATKDFDTGSKNSNEDQE